MTYPLSRDDLDSIAQRDRITKLEEVLLYLAPVICNEFCSKGFQSEHCRKLNNVLQGVEEAS